MKYDAAPFSGLYHAFEPVWGQRRFLTLKADEMPDDAWNYRENEKQRSKISYRINSPGEFMMVRWDWVRILKKGDYILFFAALLNLAHATKARERRKGWFYYSIARMERDLGFERSKQARIIRILRRKKLIKYKLKGRPAHREFKINYNRLLDAIDASRIFEDDQTDVPFGENE